MLVASLLCSCGQSNSQNSSKPDSISASAWAELLRIDQANPLADLQSAIRTNDFRFLSIYGLGLITPGIDHHPPLTNINPIEGTSDAFETEKHLRLILKATEYAEIYNRALETYLKTNRVKE